MDGYPAGAICLSDCDTACAWSGSVGDLQADRSLWLGTRVAEFWNLLGLIPVGVATALLIWTLIIGIAHAPDAVRLGLVPSVLITDGPYRFTRNPMYVAELALWLGWALFFGSLAVFLGCIALLLVVNLVIVPREERSLEAAFGQAYLMYKKRVPRWLGQANSLR
jgi:protein-S-isoprenylcysteine O-methyltransferase Ste14